MIVSLIAALSRNRVIGRDGGLPWRLPDDLRHFMRVTSGHVVVMGRRTWESMDGPLRNRTNVVVSRTADAELPGAVVVRSLDEAISLAESEGETELFLCGGSAIYAEGMSHADRMYLTLVDAEVDGDTFFPEFNERDWRVVDEGRYDADERHAFAFVIRTYERGT